MYLLAIGLFILALAFFMRYAKSVIFSPNELETGEKEQKADS